ncbi:uncharacterized protein LOC131223587 [Magnolia sinica]|uniref:uncharacterized protein LOC131223587 n=1 Tax=Magnolia sinica TaxID=86752 RepID=UPI0026583EC9|nr:uncharacterized protein LOC131223587 [Magnolia sinica]
MKISSSSSHSPSSSSSYTNARSQNSDNSPTPGCLPKILRRLLCGNNLYIQPSNCAEEADRFDILPSEDQKTQSKINGSSSSFAASPSLVARLMGLESMPEFPRTAPESIARSRSANSLNSWAEIFPIHRGVRASTSFREVPTFLRQENQDFLLLSFGSAGGDESLVLGPKGLKSDVGFGELKERRADRQKGKPKEIRREKGNDHCRIKASEVRKNSNDRCRSKVSEVRMCDKCSQKARDCSEIKRAANPCKKETSRKQCFVPRAEISRTRIDGKEILVSDGAKRLKKKKNRNSAAKKVESECSSENSSPVSVLDRAFDIDTEFLMDSETVTSEDPRPSPSNSRRKLSGPENFEYPSSHISCISILHNTKLKSPDDEGDLPQKMRHNRPGSFELWREICKLAEEDAENSNWVTRNGSKSEEIEEIGIEFAVLILDCILQEAIDELVQLPQLQ